VLGKIDGVYEMARVQKIFIEIIIPCHPDMLLVGIQRLTAGLEKALDPD